MSDSPLRRRYVEQAPRPPEGRFSLDALLPGSGPLELDVGFGRGQSLFERATAAPGSRLIGIEVKAKWVYKVAERLKAQEVQHVCVLCGDAREVLARAETLDGLDKVAIHFPDPWWKKKHQKRRVIGETLLGELRRLMRQGGELFIQTDVQDRAEQFLALLDAVDGFELLGDRGLVTENPFSARSNREWRALEDGLPVWRILARRN